jgi:hypothetical protein
VSGGRRLRPVIQPLSIQTLPAQPQLILGFGDTPRRAIEAGITAIADLLIAVPA